MTFANDVLNAAWASFYQNHPIMLVTQNTVQTFTTSTPTVVDWTNVQGDNYAAASLSSNNYTIPVAGWYRCSVILSFAGNATGIRFVNATKNGVSQIFVSNRAPTSATSSCAMDGVFQCAVGDVIQIIADQNSGGNLSTVVSSTYTSSWSMEWLRG